MLFGQDFHGNRDGLEFFKEGVNHYNRKSFEAAIDFFRKALGINPSDSTTRFFLGRHPFSVTVRPIRSL